MATTGILFVVLLLAANAWAQQSVYKWVDDDGVVHFGAAPPPGVPAERITTDPAPPAPTQGLAPREPRPQSPTAAPADAPPAPAPEAPTPISELPLEELDRRCEQARAAKIAPLKAAEIARCKAEPRTDPAFCEQFNADFGEGGRTVSGAMRPRMFDDLPECVTALEERNRRES
ncbi:MAG: DUF4124 domain-containing protein [Pseudomonadota bacterium]